MPRRMAGLRSRSSSFVAPVAAATLASAVPAATNTES